MTPRPTRQAQWTAGFHLCPQSGSLGPPSLARSVRCKGMKAPPSWSIPCNLNELLEADEGGLWENNRWSQAMGRSTSRENDVSGNSSACPYDLWIGRSPVQRSVRAGAQKANSYHFYHSIDPDQPKMDPDKHRSAALAVRSPAPKSSCFGARASVTTLMQLARPSATTEHPAERILLGPGSSPVFQRLQRALSVPNLRNSVRITPMPGVKILSIVPTGQKP